MEIKGRHGIPAEERSLTVFGTSQAEAFTCAQPYTALIWNIFKSKKKKWLADFAQLHPLFDIFLLQEARLNFQIPWNPFANHLRWIFGESFNQHRNGNAFGVLTGSRVQESQAFNKHGPVREPLLNTPKSSAFSYYPIQNRSEQLLLINTHFINFRTSQAFLRQLEQVAQIIATHQGPLLLAGDFNTWSRQRTQLLIGYMRSLNLEAVRFANERRLVLLDYIFIRELTVTEAHLLPHIRSSDHTPLTVSFKIEPSAWTQ